MGTVLMLSRVADSLYWTGRYLERAEHTARLVDVNLKQMLDETPEVSGRRWARVLACLRAHPSTQPGHENWTIAGTLMFDRDNPESIAACIAAARENARQVREQVTSEIWERINSLHLHVCEACDDPHRCRVPQEFLREVISGCQQVYGIFSSLLLRGEGWHFIQAGRAIERGSAVTALLAEHARDLSDGVTGGSGQFLTWTGLLRSVSAFEAYCRNYTADVRPEKVLEFLLLSPIFPRSVASSAKCLQEALTAIGPDPSRPESARPCRLASRLAARLSYASLDEVQPQDYALLLRGIGQEFLVLNEAIHSAWISCPTPAGAAEGDAA